MFATDDKCLSVCEGREVNPLGQFVDLAWKPARADCAALIAFKLYLIILYVDVALFFRLFFGRQLLRRVQLFIEVHKKNSI